MRGTDHRIMNAIVSGWLSASILLISGCPVPCGWPAGPPSISFTSVPPFGSFANLRGRTSGVLPFTHRVVVYIRVGNTWWVKPTAANPLTVIKPSCNWKTDITTGGLDHEAVEIRAFVVSEDYTAQVNALPPDDVVLASVTTTRKPSIKTRDLGYIGNPAQIRGRVDDIDPASYRVVAYLQVDGRWWVKPTAAEPLTFIADDGSWAVGATTANTDALATRIWVGIVRMTFLPAVNELPNDSDVIVSACAARGAGDVDMAVSCEVEDLFDFAEQQMRAAGDDPTAGGLPAAFATQGTEGLPSEFVDYAANRAMVYDATVLAIAMARLTPLRREAFIRQIADALTFTIEQDPVGDGRIRDAYYSNDIRAPNRDQPSIQNRATHVGNAAWVIMALCHAQAVTGEARYLAAAEDLGEWIESQMRANDELGGYYGGSLFPPDTTDYTDSGLARVEWRSVEHNADLISAFRSLADLTSRSIWLERGAHARRFVESPSMHDCSQGTWYLGTTIGSTANASALAEDTATWPWMVGVRPCADSPLTWALSELRTTTNGFDGIRFSNSGDGVVSESTAHLALALRLAGQDEVADELLDSLRAMKENAPSADGRGIVAAPASGDGVDSGLGARHFACPNVAATAWTILAATATSPFDSVAGS